MWSSFRYTDESDDEHDANEKEEEYQSQLDPNHPDKNYLLSSQTKPTVSRSHKNNKVVHNYNYNELNQAFKPDLKQKPKRKLTGGRKTRRRRRHKKTQKSKKRSHHRKTKRKY